MSGSPQLRRWVAHKHLFFQVHRGLVAARKFLGDRLDSRDTAASAVEHAHLLRVEVVLQPTTGRDPYGSHRQVPDQCRAPCTNVPGLHAIPHRGCKTHEAMRKTRRVRARRPNEASTSLGYLWTSWPGKPLVPQSSTACWRGVWRVQFNCTQKKYQEKHPELWRRRHGVVNGVFRCGIGFERILQDTVRGGYCRAGDAGEELTGRLAGAVPGDQLSQVLHEFGNAFPGYGREAMVAVRSGFALLIV